MSDLEDDVLMMYLEEQRKVKHLEGDIKAQELEIRKLKQRDRMLNNVWEETNALLKKMAMHPEVFDDAPAEVERLKRAIATVIALDEGGVPLDIQRASDAKPAGERSG